MESMLAYCGIDCESCPIHLASLEQDMLQQQSMRKSIAEQCAQYYGMILQPEEITDCDGCTADTGRLFSGCVNCEIRKCALLKNIKSCAYCADYACKLLLAHFATEPGSKTRLEEIRQFEVGKNLSNK